MLNDFITARIRHFLPFTPTEQQAEAMAKLGTFLADPSEQKVFLLNGYAGTGKTSLVAAMVKALRSLGQNTILLAPTGRAAKVLSHYAEQPAYTIHKRIYRQKSQAEPSFGLSFNTHKDTLFIVDEASMIATRSGHETAFGTGNLLDDLVRFVFSGTRCHLLLMGDQAQLPPVGESESNALNVPYMESYGLRVRAYTLTQVVRQALGSGILTNATHIREQLSEQNTACPPTFDTSFADLQKVDGTDFIDTLERSYQEVGEEETMVIVRSNRRMNLYNQGIRSRILWRESALDASDRLMVTRNNYFWTQAYEGLDFIANGDMFVVTRLRHEHELYGFRFVEASLRSVDEEWEIEALIWMDTLLSESPDATYRLQEQLTERIKADYPELRSQKELWKKVLESPYYNALQVKHAYAVTCHKAQGGQWKRVFIDQGALPPEGYNTDYYRWLYTALTRATEQVYLLNF